MKRKVLLLILAALLLSLTLTACIPGDGSYTPRDPAGFFWGIWHGWLAPISLLVGFFDDKIRIYEAANTGWWYDFGFYIAVISGFGGISLFRRKKSDRHDK